ncbi:hypothetical protein [Hymenobacter koreensis]|uniref:Uncharacterized protein n=1 Tax=Hymenobacter koreensis TaxID=1084523 RepID=A0ABP8JCS4_9BACT
MDYSQEWFEMADLRRRSLMTKVWVPLAAAQELYREGEHFHVGFKEEYFGCETVAVSLESKADAMQLDWSYLNDNGQEPRCTDEDYTPADVQDGWGDEPIGIRLVLRQAMTPPEIDEWHLHQDLVIALGLKREGDIWVCPREAYFEVASLKRKANGEPALLVIHAEHLRDYLRARGMGLLSSTYSSREAVTPDANYLDWSSDYVIEESTMQKWTGDIRTIHESGSPFGQDIAVMHVGRTDVDKGEDVPNFGLPRDGQVAVSSGKIKAGSGRLLMLVRGELWRTEWLDPATLSARVRRDSTPGTAFFVTDTGGTQETKSTLTAESRWLWFRPNIINELASRRGATHGWDTRETGWISVVPGRKLRFGLNDIGLVNVYAKDIAQLPDWQQKIWAGYSNSPDGGVSNEFLAAQMEARPADTEAPEERLSNSLAKLRTVTEQNLGFSIIRTHTDYDAILSKTHRFRATDYTSLLALAKDVARLTADSLDVGAIQKMLPPIPKGEKPPGSLKSLEKLLATKLDPTYARNLLTPLVGTYELRLGDAHLASSKIQDAWGLVGIDNKLPFVWQGEQLLAACASSIEQITYAFSTLFNATAE